MRFDRYGGREVLSVRDVAVPRPGGGEVPVAGRPCVGFAHVLHEKGTAHLQQLAVDPASGRRGLGTALVRACCEEARRHGFDQLTLTTFRDVAFNAPWYSRLGFVVVEQPTGVLARHVQQEQRYARLAPRVAMSRSLGLTRGQSRVAGRSGGVGGDVCGVG